jgi:uncharacterized protein
VNAVHRILDRNTFDQATRGLCALAVMTKAPRAGQVKTRLVPPLTPEEAAQLNRCFLRDTAAAISQAVEKVARGIAVYTPPGTEAHYIDVLPNEFALVSQRGDDFGERLINAAADLFHIGFSSVCLVDSDSPTVPSPVYAQAARLLSTDHDRIVLGPCDDGGYYLIGLKRLHRRAFESIDWSTEHVLEQTIERAQELQVPVELLPMGYDIDDRASLCRLCHELLDTCATSGDSSAPETKKLLSDIVAREGRARICA